MKYYPFELHTHTVNSDGDFLPEELINNAIYQGLKGFSLTDHNTTSGIEETRKKCKEKDVLFLPGLEWTTFYGHITIIGGKSTSDYRTINPQSVVSETERVKGCGDVAILAHPCRAGSPSCTGCKDDFLINDYSVFNGIEVWSGYNPHIKKSNENSEKMYYDICQKGSKVAAVYGRDWHRKDAAGAIVAATYIGVDKLDLDSVIEAIKARRTYISLGLVADIFLKNKLGEIYPLGSIIKPGDYTLVCRLEQETAKFASKNIKIEEIHLDGTAILEETKARIAIGGYAKKVCLNKGFLKININGEVEGMKAKLLLATPFFVEE